MSDGKKKCLIFGFGKYGKKLYIHIADLYDVIGFVDNDKSLWNTKFDKVQIYSPDQIKKLKVDIIFVATIYYRQVAEQLCEMNILNYKCAFADDNEYQLFDTDLKPVFSGCKTDLKLAEEIRNDFSVNYPKSNFEKCKNISADNIKTKQKTILYCAYHYPPRNNAGVQRSVKFTKYLSKLGYHVIVLTTEKSRLYSLNVNDEELLDEIPHDVEIIRFDEKYINWDMLPKEDKQEIFNLCLAIYQSDEWIEPYQEKNGINKVGLLPDSGIIWTNECLKNIEQRIDLNKVDLVFTTANPYSDFAVGYFIKNKYKIPRIMDYRDPWSLNAREWSIIGDSYGNAREQVKKIEKIFVDSADAIVAAAHVTLDELIEKMNYNRENTYEIRNGYDEDDFKNIIPVEKKKNVFRVCHNGDLYVERNPKSFIEVVGKLIEDGFVQCCDVEIIFTGVLAAEIKESILDADKWGIVKINPRVTHKESISLGMSADLLLLLGSEEESDKGGIPGKVFEYLRIGKPILAMALKGGDIDEILTESDRGRTFSYSDKKGMVEFFKELYINYKDNKGVCFNGTDKIVKYSREEEARKLASIIETCIGDGERYE